MLIQAIKLYNIQTLYKTSFNLLKKLADC